MKQRDLILIVGFSVGFSVEWPVLCAGGSQPGPWNSATFKSWN